MTIAKRLLLALAIIMTAPIAAQAKDAPPTKSYDTVVLWAVGMERKHQRKIEESVVKILAKKGVTGIAMVDLTEDGKGYTQAQILELIVQSGAQAIFEVADAGPEGLKQIRSHATQDIIQSG
jgi:ethanolamine utilization protein EutP (predicted NTPase)